MLTVKHNFQSKLNTPFLCLGLLVFASGCTVGAYEVPDPGPTEPTVPLDGSSTGGRSSSLPEPPEETSFERTPLTTLIQQTVQWADLDITVESAVTTTCSSSSWFVETTKLRCHCIEGTVKNRTSAGRSLGANRWDLILADGTRLKATADSEDFGPFDALPFSECYADESSRTLDGATVEFHGREYGTFTPLLLPLDQPIQREAVLSIDELVGQIVDPVENGLKHEILAAHISMSNDAPARRAYAGKKLFIMKVRTTYTGPSYIFVRGRTYHLMVDGVGVSTSNTFSEYLKRNESVEVDVVFDIDADVQNFEVEFDTGTVAAETFTSFPVDLSRATSVE